MAGIDSLKRRLGDSPAAADDALLLDTMSSAKSAILSRRYPFGYADGTEVPEPYADLQVRIALDLINRMGAEGQISHSENGVQRTYESGWISESLLAEVTPKVGVPS